MSYSGLPSTTDAPRRDQPSSLIAATSAEPANGAMTSAERQRILVDWNNTEVPFPADRCLHELFEEQVARTPQAIALVFGGQSQSYAQLNAQANRLAHHLRSLGVGPDRLVALCLPRGPQTIVAMLAILKAGGAYVPLDPQYPAQRLAFMLSDAAPQVVITEQSLLAPFSGYLIEANRNEAIVCLDRDAALIQGQSAENLTNVNSSRDLVYVIYTSGSTGQPKGVLIEHRGLVNNLFWQIREFDFHAGDRFLQRSAIIFDASCWELWTPLLIGAVQVIASQDDVKDAPRTLRLMAEQRITIAQCVPSLLSVLIAEMERQPITLQLRMMIPGGEALPVQDLRRWSRLSDAELINTYGPTECTIDATFHRCNRHTTDEQIPIGRPLANTRVYILDAAMQPVTIGSTGELYIGSIGIARGYLNRPELTAERFVADPFMPGERLYRTGDLGSFRNNGEIVFHGRIDHQVKIRGYRIELGEIESTLLSFPGVREAVVTTREQSAGDIYLVAYYVPRDPADNGDANAGTLRAHLTDCLPGYMVPAAYVRLAAMPHLPNGKLDRAALPAPTADAYDTADYKAPQGQIEAQLALIWAEMLNLEQVGRNDNFSDLGGHSLLAMQIANRIRQALGLEVSAYQILAKQTITELARLLGGLSATAITQTNGEQSQLPQLSIAAHSRPQALHELAEPNRYFATPSQVQVAFFSLLTPGNRAYLTQSMMIFRGALDVPVLHRTLQEVVDRHQHFRTTYALEDDGSLIGTIQPSLVVELPLCDLSAMPESARGEMFDRLCDTLLNTGIDPQQLPLVKWFLFRLSDNEYRLLMVEHHYVHDGWSVRKVLSEMADIYTAWVAGREHGLPLPTQFCEYARWQCNWLQSAPARANLAQWVSYLRGSESLLTLPFARQRPLTPRLVGGQVAARISGDLTANLQSLATAMRATLFQIMYGAFAMLVRRYSGRRDFLLGTSSANRTRVEWESLLGMLVNMVAVRIQFDEKGSPRDWLRQCATSLQQALSMSELPFAMVVDALKPIRLPGVMPLLQFQFSSHNALTKELRFADLDWELCEALSNGTSKFDLGVISIPQPANQGVELLFEFNADLFDHATVQQISRDYQQLLETLVNEPDTHLAVLLANAAPARSALVEGHSATNHQQAIPVPVPVAAVVTMERFAIEEKLTAIWSEVLQVTTVALDDDFFELGGHSILAMRVVARMRRAFDCELTMNAIFEAPTVRSLAARLGGFDLAHSAEAKAITHLSPAKPALALVQTPALPTAPQAPTTVTAAANSTRAIEARYPTAKIPASAAQRELWFIERLDGAGSTYNVPYAVRLHGKLDTAALAAALSALIARHESLRTCFVSNQGIPLQQVCDARPLDLPVRRLQGTDRAERERNLQKALHNSFTQSFDLAHAPLLRAWLWQLQGDEHALLLSLHHIITDGWSMAVLVSELNTLYSAFTVGAPSPLAPLPIQFADYAIWQQERLASEPLQQQLRYWRTRLDGLEPLQLPLDRPRPVRPTYRGAEVSFELTKTMSAQLNSLARERHASLFMVLLAAFQTLLMRWSGQHDLAVGAPVAGRNRTELEGLIGCFVNMLVVRTDLSGDPGFDELIARVRHGSLQAFEHQEVPFDQLVATLRPQRELSANPLFQVSFALNGMGPSKQAMSGLRGEPIEVSTITSKFDLSLSFSDLNDQLQGRIEYSTELFESATIERLAAKLQQLLEGIVADPHCKLSLLPLIDENERARLLKNGQGLATSFPADRCLHELFEEQVARTPQAIALLFGSQLGTQSNTVLGTQSLSYAQLNAQANCLAHYLRSLGVGPDRLVALCLPRGPQTIVAMLAILKAGGAYVPLDPQYPAQRLAFMLSDAAPQVVITEQSLLAPFSGYLIEANRNEAIVCLDRDAALIQGQSAENLTNVNSSRDLVYVIYTSGSTGQPKGVLIEHQAVTRLVVNSDYVSFGPSDCVAQAANHSFDAATFEVWGALLNGARLAIVPKEELLSAPALAKRIHDDGITTLFLTTSLFNELSAQAPAMFTGMANLVFGGEAGDPRAVARVMAAGAPARLINGYGPTEATTFASWYQAPASASGSALASAATAAATAATTASLPIGKPLANTQVYILDQHLQPTPVGVSGEIYIGGVAVARGYLNRPELTAEKFIADPFGGPDSRLYRTGDLGCWMADGNMGYRGRIDQQVKLRGFRIELGEIEAALRACPGVRDAVVMLRERSPGDSRLIAWYVPESSAPNDPHQAPLARDAVDVAALRSALRQRLPDYMIPANFVALDALSLTANGKLDRAALLLPELVTTRSAVANSPGASATVHMAAQYNAAQAQLVTLWEDILDTRPIGLDDDFFELGGHSLLAVQLLASIEQQFGKMLRLASLFECPTIRQLASVLDQTEEPATNSCVVAVHAKGSKPPIFFISGWGGAVLVFHRLARELGPDQPLYILDHSVFGQEPNGDLSVEHIASQMIAQMRLVQHAGPYHLCGFSLGGKFVYEMAQQLQRSGQSAAMLALMDCNAPGYPKTRGFAVRTLLHMQHAFSLGPATTLSYLFERVRRLKKYFVRVDPQLFADNISMGSTALARAMQQAADLILRSWELYEPQYYPGHLVLIRAAVKDRRLGVDNSDPHLGWSELIGQGIEVHDMPCNHHRMVDPEYARYLAQILAHCIAGNAAPALRSSVAHAPVESET